MTRGATSPTVGSSKWPSNGAHHRSAAGLRSDAGWARTTSASTNAISSVSAWARPALRAPAGPRLTSSRIVAPSRGGELASSTVTRPSPATSPPSWGVTTVTSDVEYRSDVSGRGWIAPASRRRSASADSTSSPFSMRVATRPPASVSRKTRKGDPASTIRPPSPARDHVASTSYRIVAVNQTRPPRPIPTTSERSADRHRRPVGHRCRRRRKRCRECNHRRAPSRRSKFALAFLAELCHRRKRSRHTGRPSGTSRRERGEAKSTGASAAARGPRQGECR